MQNAAEMTAPVLKMTYLTLSNKIERNPLPGKQNRKLLGIIKLAHNGES